MSKKNKLILVVSEKMNKHSKRNEDFLIRMSATARENMGFKDNEVEVWTNDNTQSRINSSKLLNTFQAYSSDIKNLLKNGNLTENEINRIGFVTSTTYNRIMKNKESKNIWVSDSIEDTVLGSDPEFLLFSRDTEEVIKANNILSKQAILGCDGAMAEVRPNPAITPENLVRNIKKILSDTDNTEKIDSYKWGSGCYFKDNTRDYPIGGHIHIGNPLSVARLTKNNKEYLFRSMNRILDDLVAIPMIKLDGAQKGAARRTTCTMGTYGFFGDWRPCNGHFEYRTLSGMWMMHPTVATAVIGTVKAITDEVFLRAHDKNFENKYVFPAKFRQDLNSLWVTFDRWEDIPLVKSFGCERSSSVMRQILNESKPTQIDKTFLTNWLGKMKKLSTYNKNKKYIKTLHRILQLPFATFNSWDNEIQNNWLTDKKFVI